MVSKVLTLLSLVVVTTLSTTTEAWRHIPKFAVLPVRGGGFGGSTSNKATITQEERTSKKDMGWFSGYVTKLFNEADTNKDGTLQPSEAYDLVLKFYIMVNRQAPIPPPSRERVEHLLKQADTSRSGTLNIDEFRRLLRTMYARASSRVLAHKFVKIICAPLCAIGLVNLIQATPYMLDLLGSCIPEWTPSFLETLLTKKSLWQTIFTVLFVSQLARLALGFVDWLWWGDKKDFYEELEELKEKLKED